jgi:tetratricopeptide (TPR) repeat protein
VRQILMACAGIVAGAVVVVAQPPQTAQQLFEAGQYDQSLQRIAQQRQQGTAGPADTYLAGQVLLKLHRAEEARREFEALAQTGDPVWGAIGQSASALAAHDNQRALELAVKVAETSPGSFHAHYQLGLVRAEFSDWAGCAAAFHRAAEIDPGFAYAHYYAGLSYSRIRRADRTSEHIERFLKLAPSAPERGAVESLMRTLRGV